MNHKNKPKDATHWSYLNGMYYMRSNGQCYFWNDGWKESNVTDLNTDNFEVLV